MIAFHMLVSLLGRELYIDLMFIALEP